MDPCKKFVPIIDWEENVPKSQFNSMKTITHIIIAYINKGT